MSTIQTKIETKTKNTDVGCFLWNTKTKNVLQYLSL